MIPPGIHVVYRIALTLFGETTWGIRVADLACVLVLGLLVARLVAPSGERVRVERAAAACFVRSLVHYGFFDWWTTAQTELWYTTASFAAIVCASHVRSLRRAALGTGVLVGLALLLKPPSVAYAAIAVFLLLRRARSETRLARTFAELGAGIAAPVALTLVYFAATGALGAMFDIVILGNRHYARAFPSATSPLAILKKWWSMMEDFSVLGGVALAALVVGLARGDRRRWRLGAALVVAAFAAVTLQQKFFEVHWVTVVGPLAYVICAAADGAARTLSERYAAERVWLAAILVAVLAYSIQPGPRGPFALEARAAFRYRTGAISREQFAAYFVVPSMIFYERDVEDAASFIRSRARPDDGLCVRGFVPQIYAMTGLRYGGRFFWTNFIVHPSSYRREELLDEDWRAFLATRPRFVVTMKHQQGAGNVESIETYKPLGYRLVHDARSLQVLELGDSAP